MAVSVTMVNPSLIMFVALIYILLYTYVTHMYTESLCVNDEDCAVVDSTYVIVLLLLLYYIRILHVKNTSRTAHFHTLYKSRIAHFTHYIAVAALM
jgi:hypothetical protein